MSLKVRSGEVVALAANPIGKQHEFHRYPPDNYGEEDDTLPDDAKEGLFNVRALTLLALWYFFSFCTLFLNKYILSFMQGEPTLLGMLFLFSSAYTDNFNILYFFKQRFHNSGTDLPLCEKAK